MLMQDFIIEIIYDNFILVFWLAIACIIFVLSFTTWIVKHQIGTKVLIVRETTGEIVGAKEKLGEGTVKIKKKLFMKRGEPIVMQSLLRPYRFYLHEEGSDFVVSPAAYVPNIVITKDKETGKTISETITEQEIKTDSSINMLYQKLLEGEVVQQAVRGLVGSVLEKIIYMLAGGLIFVILWEVIRGIFGGGN